MRFKSTGYCAPRFLEISFAILGEESGKRGLESKGACYEILLFKWLNFPLEDRVRTCSPEKKVRTLQEVSCGKLGRIALTGQYHPYPKLEFVC
jgi:hypothetical protein